MCKGIIHIPRVFVLFFTEKHSKDYSAYVTEKITLNVPALSPVARDLVVFDLVGTHSASADLSPVKSDKNIY